MDILSMTTLALVGQATNIAIVAVGLGLVIFFHELGHFAVAKWCDVNVERFSIGFGPILWRRKWGETEYALSAIPFGGYVKMLGQDDIDPSQLTSDEIAEDPRSYTAKGVGQRMAIISAGVIMNVVTGLLFFLLAFRAGVDVTPSVVGDVQVGMPAWQAGLRTGDRITSINERPIKDFSDLMRATALSSGPLEIDTIRPDRTTFSVTLQPDQSGTRRRMGVGPSRGLEVFDLPPSEGIPCVVPGSAAEGAVPGIEPGDTITQVNGEPVTGYAQLTMLLARSRDQTVQLTVERSDSGKDRSPEILNVSVPAAPFRSLGMTMEFGKIAALRNDSPAALAGLQIGDRLASVDGQDIGTDIDPLRLPDYLGEKHGQPVMLFVERSLPGGDKQQLEIEVVPDDRPGWSEAPTFENTPISVPSIGIAYHMVPTVLSVEEGGPAAEAGIKPSETITKLELIREKSHPQDGAGDDVLAIDVGETNWAHAFWQMQRLPARQVRLTVQSAGSEERREVDLIPQPAEEWFLPTTRGIQLLPLSVTRKAETATAALAMGWNHTQSSMMDIYLTLRSLVTRRLSVKELHGPIGIVKVAHDVASAGLVPFLLFLGFLSINLAVLNFLPIPVLDGGHMVFLLWEAATRRKPSERIVIAATWMGMIFVLGLMVMVIYLDISRLM